VSAGFSGGDGSARRVKGLLNREVRSAMESSDSERSSPPGPVFENDDECDGRTNGESERRREPDGVGKEKSEESIV
jgi:hypothetical protein